MAIFFPRYQGVATPPQSSFGAPRKALLSRSLQKDPSPKPSQGEGLAKWFSQDPNNLLTFAKIKRSLQDAFLHSRTVGSKPLHKALARTFSRFFCNLREARGRRDLTNYCGFWKGFALLARFFSTFLALRCTTNYLVIVARIHTQHCASLVFSSLDEKRGIHGATLLFMKCCIGGHCLLIYIGSHHGIARPWGPICGSFCNSYSK